MPYNPYLAPQYAPPIPDILGQMKANYKPSGELLFVLGETEAVGYPVAPNTTVTLWDANKNTIYVKTVNAQGMPSLKVFDYKERVQGSESAQNHECSCGKDFVRKEAFEELCAKMERLEGLIQKEVEK